MGGSPPPIVTTNAFPPAVQPAEQLAQTVTGIPPAVGKARVSPALPTLPGICAVTHAPSGDALMKNSTGVATTFCGSLPSSFVR
jgi:hypothetical protein